MPIDFLHEGIILDACCVINIYASGQMRAILNSIPKSVAVAAFVQKREARYIYGNPLGKGDTSKPNERINLQPFIQDKLLIIVSPNSTDENDDAVHFGRSIDTGEAISGAIAKSRNWSIALDDRDAIAFFSATISHIQLIPTLALVKNWEDETQASATAGQQVLKNIQLRANYSPRPNHPYYGWWSSHMINAATTVDTTLRNP